MSCTISSTYRLKGTKNKIIFSLLRKIQSSLSIEALFYLMCKHHLIYNSFLQCYVGKNSDLKFLLSNIVAISHMWLLKYKLKSIKIKIHSSVTLAKCSRATCVHWLLYWEVQNLGPSHHCMKSDWAALF